MSTRREVILSSGCGETSDPASVLFVARLEVEKNRLAQQLQKR